MTVTYVSNLPVPNCKSVYEHNLSGALPQQQRVKAFVDQHQLADVLYVDGQDFMDPSRSYECIVFTVNDYQFVSLQKLTQMLQHLKQYANKYFYVAINKFLLYTEQDNQLQTKFVELDEKLVFYLADSVGATMVESYYHSDDHGHLGNFTYPITQLIFDVTR